MGLYFLTFLNSPYFSVITYGSGNSSFVFLVLFSLLTTIHYSLTTNLFPLPYVIASDQRERGNLKQDERYIVSFCHSRSFFVIPAKVGIYPSFLFFYGSIYSTRPYCGLDEASFYSFYDFVGAQ
jgi:hypothetical protein